jgi:hypothetical protein
LDGGAGIFCANFFSRRGDFAPCKDCWCPECFVPLGHKPFLVRQQVDEEGTILEEVGVETRHMQARAGGGMMGVMQCELCGFRNIMQRDPDY